MARQQKPAQPAKLVKLKKSIYEEKTFIVLTAIFALSAYCLAEEPAPCEVLNPHKPYLENFESYGPTVTSALSSTKGHEISPSWWENALTPTCWTVGNEKVGTDPSVCTSTERAYFPYIFSNGSVTVNTTTGVVTKNNYYDKGTALTTAKYAPEGHNALKLYTSTTYGIVWAAMPELTVEDISSLVISASAKFTAATKTIPHALIVGIMDDPTDISTFVVLDSIATGAGVAYSIPAQKIEVSVIEKGYSGKGRYVAFRTAYNPNAAASAKYKVCGTTVYLDSVALRVEPFYAQNNWETESDWSWKQMVRMSDSICRMDSVVFGGLGINFNDTADTPEATLVLASDFKGDAVQAKDTVSFTYNISTKEVTMTLIGRPTYKITTSVNLSSRGYTTGDTAVFYGDTVTISAEAYYGYNFTRWDDYNTDNPRKVKVTNDINYQATFSKNKYQLTVSANGPGSVTGGGSYSYNTKNTITATPDPNCQFIQWNDGNTDNPRDITLTQDTAFVASFSAPATAQIVVVYDMQGHGEAIENDTINSGEQITEPAKPTTDGFEFVGWFKEAACETLFDFNQTITATQDSTMTLYAYWAKTADKSKFESGETSSFTLDANISASVTGTKVSVENGKLRFDMNQNDRLITVNAKPGCTIIGFIVEYTGTNKVTAVKLGNDVVASGVTIPLSNVQSFTLNIWFNVITAPQRMAPNATMDKPNVSISSIKVLYNAPAPAVETYGRKVTNGKYGTICLNKKFTSMEGVDGLYVPSYKDPTTLYCVEMPLNEVVAGNAYIFKAKADSVTFTLEGEAVAAAVEANNMLGWLAADTIMSQQFIDDHAGYMLLTTVQGATEQTLIAPEATSTLKKNCAMINVENVTSDPQTPAPGRRLISFGRGSATDVMNINSVNASNGKMIINGQLVILRDGKRYNAQGQEL